MASWVRTFALQYDWLRNRSKVYVKMHLLLYLSLASLRLSRSTVMGSFGVSLILDFSFEVTSIFLARCPTEAETIVLDSLKSNELLGGVIELLEASRGPGSENLTCRR